MKHTRTWRPRKLACLIALTAALLPAAVRAVWTDGVRAVQSNTGTFDARAYSAETGWQEVPGRAENLFIFDIWVRARIWTLLGEPLVVCDFAWRPKAGAYAPPEGVQPRTVVIDFPAPFYLESASGRIVCDAGIPMGPAGKALVEDTFSFTLPSAPGWDRLAMEQDGWRDIGHPRGAYWLQKAQKDARDLDPKAVLRAYAALCPHERSRTQHNGWQCDGLHSMVWTGKVGGATRERVFVDLDMLDYNHRLSRKAHEIQEAELGQLIEQQQRERTAAVHKAQQLSGDDFWNTPADTRSAAAARDDEQALKRVSDAAARMQDLARSLAQATEARDQEQQRKHAAVAAARSGDLCKLVGGRRAASGQCEEKKLVGAGGRCETHDDCKDDEYMCRTEKPGDGGPTYCYIQWCQFPSTGTFSDVIHPQPCPDGYSCSKPVWDGMRCQRNK